MGNSAVTSNDVIQAIRCRFGGSGYVFLENVADGTGSAKSRMCDAMVMGIWPSVGFHLQGFEVKVARSDWLRELQQPEKSAAFERFCHRWWIAAPPGVVELSEMPANWGLMVVKGERTKVAKMAELKTHREIPVEFFAAALRHACEKSDLAVALREARDSGYEDGRESQRLSQEASAKAAAIKQEAIDKRLDVLAEAGINLFSDADVKAVADYFNLRRANNVGERLASELSNQAGWLTRLGNRAIEMAKELEGVAVEEPEESAA